MARDASARHYLGVATGLVRHPGRSGLPAPMMDFLENTLRNVTLFGQEALSGGNIWILMLIVVVAIGVVASMRGKLTDGWIWIPALALAVWYALYRWLQLRA